jgi:pilus assembly protein CpaC
MLEVKIAEVSKTLIDKLGAGVQGSVGNGMWTYSLLTQFLTNTLAGSVTAARTTGTKFTLEAEKKDGLVKILAEPNVMAISGQEGSFLAGGKILIPVAQDTLANRITLEEKEFGVGLKFTPTVLAGGRINLKVSPEVSELSREGVGISNLTNTTTALLPLITTRRASTTVQLADGQSFAIGGLIKNNRTTNIKAFPILGEIPLIGALFRSTDFQQDRTELVFVVTPRLVKPLNSAVRLPTDGLTDPSRSELFLGGQMEGKPASGGKQGRVPDGFEVK